MKQTSLRFPFRNRVLAFLLTAVISLILILGQLVAHFQQEEIEKQQKGYQECFWMLSYHNYITNEANSWMIDKDILSLVYDMRNYNENLIPLVVQARYNQSKKLANQSFEMWTESDRRVQEKCNFNILFASQRNWGTVQTWLYIIAFILSLIVILLNVPKRE